MELENYFLFYSFLPYHYKIKVIILSSLTILYILI